MNFNEIKSTKKLKKKHLEYLADKSEEIRNKILEVITKNGGHLSSNLGVVESMVALHYVFDFKKDKIVFDVGHQSYAHKILSDREDKIDTIRQEGGISGFTDSSESEYDAFTSGHAGTSLSASLGLCCARDKLNKDYYVIDFVGDGSLVNGLNLEALTSSSKKPSKLIVVFNDNGMSISKNMNGFYRFISMQTTKSSYVNGKRALKKIFKNSFITKVLTSIRDFIKKKLSRGNYFENFGFKYVGIVNGNNVGEMVDILRRVKDIAKERAVFLHIKTTKGKGYIKAEEQADMFHGVGKDLTYTEGNFSLALGKKINSLIEKDNRFVAITSGMKNGTGLIEVERANPNNFYDVGIAEEYAITLSAGMAKGGLKPIVAIYSTFMQRAYDQVLHDVCLQNLPVIFCMDRAGFVGEDGKTHQGLFDISFLSSIPNLTILSPLSPKDFENAIDYAVSLNAPVAIRYPKNSKDIFENAVYEKGNQVIVKNSNPSVRILAVGQNMINSAIEANNSGNLNAEIIAVKIVKPIDEKLFDTLVPIVTMEENALIGGYGSLVALTLQNKNVKVPHLSLGVEDRFIEHGTIESQIKKCELDGKSVFNRIKKFLTEI